MQQSFSIDAIKSVTFLVGNASTVVDMPGVPPLVPFCLSARSFLDDVAKILMNNPQNRTYPELMKLGFWLRMGSTESMKNESMAHDNEMRYGRGVAFHIAPSNVPINFAYSLAVGLLMGNANVVRVPSRDFEQVEIVCNAIRESLKEHEGLASYIALVRYGRERKVNDFLSSMADIRIVWGGDATIAELRESPLPARSNEVTFADRYSLAVIDSNAYMAVDNKDIVTRAFYNDTYFADQNACTSPCLIAWLGSRKEEAKELFWSKLHGLVEYSYPFQDIQAINKLTSAYLVCSAVDGVSVLKASDNLIVRVRVSHPTSELMDYRDNSGFFFEYDCADVRDLFDVCNDKRCQTIGMLGDSHDLLPLVHMGPKGVDRIVPLGRTMDFSLIWDGYDLYAQLTRVIKIA